MLTPLLEMTVRPKKRLDCVNAYDKSFTVGVVPEIAVPPEPKIVANTPFV